MIKQPKLSRYTSIKFLINTADIRIMKEIPTYIKQPSRIYPRSSVKKS